MKTKKQWFQWKRFMIKGSIHRILGIIKWLMESQADTLTPFELRNLNTAKIAFTAIKMNWRESYKTLKARIE